MYTFFRGQFLFLRSYSVSLRLDTSGCVNTWRNLAGSGDPAKARLFFGAAKGFGTAVG